MLVLCVVLASAWAAPVSSSSLRPVSAVQSNDEAPVAHLHSCSKTGQCCPVCGQGVSQTSPFVQFNQNQVIRACSDAHLHELVENMGAYVEDKTSEHTAHEAEGTRCPMCGMDGDAHHAIDFHGNQALFMCSMENERTKQQLLTKPQDYISKLSTVSESDRREAYCSGRTVMFMYVTWSKRGL